MKKYQLINENCPIIVIDNKNFVIDNGVPISFCYENEMDIKIEDKEYHLSKNNLLLDLFKNFKNKIDGVIGLDIINSFSGLSFDLENNSFYFGTINKDHPNKVLINNFIAKIEINGKPADAYMDLVVNNVICKKDYLLNSKKIGVSKQTTLFGELDFDIYAGEINIFSNNVNEDVLCIPKQIEDKTPVCGLFNPLKYVEKYLIINFKDNAAYFE